MTMIRHIQFDITHLSGTVVAIAVFGDLCTSFEWIGIVAKHPRTFWQG
jgi:hypothetical protein